MVEAVTGVLIIAALAALAVLAGRSLRVMWRGAMLDERPLPMHRMLKRQGVTTAGVEDCATLEQVCHAARRCAACRDVEACREWLDAGKTEGYQAFCPNCEFIDGLKTKRAEVPARAPVPTT
jgi:hypothetical protein